MGRHDALDLADWRRQVAELYVDVRATARTDPRRAWEHWRTTRERLFRGHPGSPLPAVRRAAFHAIHFPYDPRLRFEVALEGAEPGDRGPAAPASSPAMAPLPVSAGEEMGASLIGWLTIPFAEGNRRLALLGLPGYVGGLFLPFRDATNGDLTYGAGRYVLDTAKGADLGGDPELGTRIVDFNFAYQPSCAFDPRWACPLAPPENRLDLAIEAGERIR